MITCPSPPSGVSYGGAFGLKACSILSSMRSSTGVPAIEKVTARLRRLAVLCSITPCDARHIILTDEGAAFFGQLAIGTGGDAPLVGHEWNVSDYGREMRAACQRAKIEGAWFHSLRHTWASLAVMGGVPLMVVARNLGHTDTRQVEKNVRAFGTRLRS